MATLKHLYTYGENTRLNELIDKARFNKLKKPTEKTELLELMRYYEISRGQGSNKFRNSCLDVQAAGSGIICRNYVTDGYSVIPYVYLNTKSGHYRCTIEEIDDALKFSHLKARLHELNPRIPKKKTETFHYLAFAEIVDFPDSETDHKYYRDSKQFVGATACKPDKYTDRPEGRGEKTILNTCCFKRTRRKGGGKHKSKKLKVFKY